MKRHLRTMLAAGLAIGSLAASVPASTEQSPDKPLVLTAGSYVGGEPVEQSYIELGSRNAADRITVNVGSPRDSVMSQS